MQALIIFDAYADSLMLDTAARNTLRGK